MTSFIYQPPDGLDGTERSLCKCCRFTRGIDLPSPRDIPLGEIQLEARRYSTRIIGCWAKLNACLKRFDAVIQRRWLKKTPKQRQDALLKAWPAISRNHRPDFMGAVNRGKSRPAASTRRSQAFLWPYINVQDLQQSHLLPLFLNSRGRHLPEMFVAMDLENAHRGHGWPEKIETNGPGLIFAGGRSPRRYARMGKGSGSTTEQVLNPIYPPIVGLFILEVQDGIYTFLLECCKGILHDFAPSEWLLAPFQPAPPVPSPARALSEWQSTPALALEAAYHTPSNFDLDRFQLLVSAKRVAIEDHIWMIRDDPEHFLHTWNEFHDHLVDYRTDSTKGSTWDLALGNMMADAWRHHWLWVDLEDLLESMDPISEQMRRANSKTGRLSGLHESNWAALDAFLAQAIRIPLDALLDGVFASPRVRRSTIGKLTDLAKPPFTPKSTCSDAEFRVHVLFSAIASPEQSALHGEQHIVDEVQHLIDGNSESSSLIDSWVRSKFSDFALIIELRRAISGFQPWARGWRLNKVADKRWVPDFLFNARMRDDAHYETLMHIPNCVGKKFTGNPADDYWLYPADKKRTKETTDQMRKVEKRLDKYWKDVDVSFEADYGIPLWPPEADYCLSAPEKRRTKKWVEPKALPASTPKSEPALHARHENLCHLSTPASENKKTEVFRTLESTTKEKIKTRGNRDTAHKSPSLSSSDSEAGPSTQTPLTAPRDKANSDDNIGSNRPILVSKRTLKVFNTLLPPPHASGNLIIGKEISWEDLLHAMNEIGLRPEKLYGSVWIFRNIDGEPCKVAPGRSIQFHEPKEVRRGSKIAHFMCKVYGRRLKYAFGWQPGMFALA